MSNRLLPQQFGAGTDISGTRIEHALDALVRVYNDVPADLVKRRWCPSHLVANYSPSSGAGGGVPAARELPWMRNRNSTAVAAPAPVQQITEVQNPQRVKSCAVPTVTDANLWTWEVVFANARPIIVSAASLFAEFQAAGPYQNDWTYIAPVPTLPPGLGNGDPTTDVTFQLCVDDGWDIENRRKLRQEVLLWRFRSDAFFSDPKFSAAADTMLPPHPIGKWQGHALLTTPLVLIPAYSRVRAQVTIPRYPGANTQSWGIYPYAGNVWALHLEAFEATR